MMRLERENGKPDETELLDLEAQIGRRLPATYRAWLSETGGGWLIDSAIRSELEDEPIADIAELFSISKIFKRLDIIGAKISTDWLPIGGSYGGDVAILDLHSEEILYLFMPRYYGKDIVGRDCAVKIAENFDQLERDLRPFDDVLKEIRN